jgi:hypothetical protein
MGTKDPDFTGFAGGPAAEAQHVAARLGGAVLLVEGAGHYPHVEMPAQTCPPIAQFLSAAAGA